MHDDNSVTVIDNGRGIPVDMHATEKKPAAEVVLTVLHAGGKFDSDTYKVSGGLHGVGVSVVNALSDWLDLEIWRDGEVWEQSYEKGDPTSKLKASGKTKKTGTKITFHADPSIFTTITYSFDTLSQRLRELAFLNKGLKITLDDERSDKKTEFRFTGGIAEFVKHLNRGKGTLHDSPIYMEGKREPGGHGNRRSVQRQLRGKYLRFREHDQYRRRRHASRWLPIRAHANDQLLRELLRHAQGAEGRSLDQR